MNNVAQGKKNAKLEEQNQYKTSKRPKRLSKMYIKTKLDVAQYVRQ